MGFGTGAMWDLRDWSIALFHKCQHAPVPYPTMLHSEQKCAHFCSEWNIVGYGTGACWDLWKWSIMWNMFATVENSNIAKFKKQTNKKLPSYLYLTSSWCTLHLGRWIGRYRVRLPSIRGTAGNRQHIRSEDSNDWTIHKAAWSQLKIKFCDYHKTRDFSLLVCLVLQLYQIWRLYLEKWPQELPKCKNQ